MATTLVVRLPGWRKQDYGFVEFSLPAAAERAKAALDKMRHGAPPKRMTVAEKKEEERRQEEAGTDGAAGGPSAPLEQAVAGAAGNSSPAKVPVPRACSRSRAQVNCLSLQRRCCCCV